MNKLFTIVAAAMLYIAPAQAQQSNTHNGVQYNVYNNYSKTNDTQNVDVYKSTIRGTVGGKRSKLVITVITDIAFDSTIEGYVDDIADKFNSATEEFEVSGVSYYMTSAYINGENRVVVMANNNRKTITIIGFGGGKSMQSIAQDVGYIIGTIQYL